MCPAGGSAGGAFFFLSHKEQFMHTLSAFYASIANNSTDAVLAAIADQTVNVIDSRYQFQENRKLLKSFAGVPDGTAVRLSSPTWNRNFQPTITPIDADATLGGNLPAQCDYEGRGPTIPRLENMGPLITRAGAGAADCCVLLWHTRNFIPAPPGEAVTIRCTSNCTGAAGGWRLGTLVPDQALPNGQYHVIGMRATGANLLAARLNIPGETERPGVLGNVDASSYVYPANRFGRAGSMGRFTNTNLPQVEALGTGALAAQVISLDLIPAGPML